MLGLAFVLELDGEGRARLGLDERGVEVEVVLLDLDRGAAHGLGALVVDLPAELDGGLLLGGDRGARSRRQDDGCRRQAGEQHDELAHRWSLSGARAELQGTTDVGHQRIVTGLPWSEAPVPESGAIPSRLCSVGPSCGLFPTTRLLAGLASGDSEAATAFVARFQRRVYGLAFTMMGDSRAAEDVAQEAFVRAWRHPGAFDARRGSVVTWLLTITRNLAIDSMRVRRPVAVDPDSVVQMPIAATEPGPEQRAGQQEDAERLHAALAQLPEEQRRAIVLAGLLGHSAREVGELEGIPLGTAKTRIRTALMRLRTALVAEEQ